jgi:hypothetical protein
MASQASSRATDAPTTITGRRARLKRAAACLSISGSPAIRRLTSRALEGAQGRSQSSTGIETKAGPRGGCIAA